MSLFLISPVTCLLYTSFSYRNYDNIPAGTLVRDARDIRPEEAIFHDAHNSLAPFSDWFRMKFLSQEGGFWVDMDVICLGCLLYTSRCV